MLLRAQFIVRVLRLSAWCAHWIRASFNLGARQRTSHRTTISAVRTLVFGERPQKQILAVHAAIFVPEAGPDNGPCESRHMQDSITITDTLDLTLSDWTWPIAEQERAAVEKNFATLRIAKPSLWNGRVLLLHACSISGRTFRGSLFETDFASLLAWRDGVISDPTVRNCFAMAAIRSADGAFLLGVMADHTANAGKIYFPAGVTDLQSVAGTRVDLEAGMWREVAEETGLTWDDLSAEPLWQTVMSGQRIAHIKVLHSREKADALVELIRDNISKQRDPELADVYAVRTEADLCSRMPPYVVFFLRSTFYSDQQF